MSLIEPCPFSPEHESRSVEFDHGDLGSVLLNPTRIYVDPIVELLFSDMAICKREHTWNRTHNRRGTF